MSLWHKLFENQGVYVLAVFHYNTIYLDKLIGSYVNSTKNAQFSYYYTVTMSTYKRYEFFLIIEQESNNEGCQ